MATFLPIDKDLIYIVGTEESKMVDISQSITDFTVSLTMDGASEIVFEVVDVDFQFAEANYFQIRRDVYYQELILEIAAIEVGRSDSVHPLYRITARNKNVQMMKRDKQPEAYRGYSASDYARTVAKRFGMDYVVEETAKKQSLVKGRNANSDDSVWSVLQRSANEAQFVCFETNNILFFCSQTFLLGKWGDPDYQYLGNILVPFGYPENDEAAFPGSGKKYILLNMPSFRRSDDDPMDTTGSIVVDRVNGRQLRPGMTINVTGIPDFENAYLVTEVAFSEGVPDPVVVSFRSPVKPKPENQGYRGGGGSTRQRSTDQQTETSVSALPQNIVAAINDYINRNTPLVSGRTVERHAAIIKGSQTDALQAASLIWAARTVQAQDERLAGFRNRWPGGPNNIRYRALVSVMFMLRKSIPVSTTVTPTILPYNIFSSINRFIQSENLSSQEATRLRESLYRSCITIYEKTTYAMKVTQFSIEYAKYPTGSPGRRILDRLRSFLIRRPPVSISSPNTYQ